MTGHRWVVMAVGPSSTDELYEYDGQVVRTIYGGALHIMLDNGDEQIWGPGFWRWAKCEKQGATP